MKKLLAIPAILLVVMTTRAEGFQVNTFSARQEGMGHTGAAMKLGAESQLFNPGALAFSTSTFEVSGAVSAISAFATATVGDDKYETDNKVSTPFNVSTSFKIFDNLYGGVALYTPYGSSINWGDYWPGAILNQKVDIKVFTVQPTVSYRILPNLSVGAGAMITWGSVNLDKAMVPSSSVNALLTAMGQPLQFGEMTPPASVNLTGSSQIAVGLNVGAMWDISKKWTVGASFRSQMRMKVKKGEATVRYLNNEAHQVLGTFLDNLDATNFSASLPCPYVLTFGASFKPIEPLIISADVQINGWSAYDCLDISFENLPAYDQHLTKNYHTALTYHLGAQWSVTKRCDLRCGLMIDTNPCDINHYNPETPGQTRLEPSVGFSFRPIPQLSVDFAFMYVQGLGTDNATGRYDDFIAKNYPQLQLPAEGTFTADYKVHAFIPALGLSYKF